MPRATTHESLCGRRAEEDEKGKVKKEEGREGKIGGISRSAEETS
jgi:hypothetical protein